MDGKLTNLLFQLETKTCSDVLNNTGCASFFQLLYSSDEMVVELINKKHRTSSYPIRFLFS
jgi:hypothetical protein